jgi:hypothetical protein
MIYSGALFAMESMKFFCKALISSSKSMMGGWASEAFSEKVSAD